MHIYIPNVGCDDVQVTSLAIYRYLIRFWSDCIVALTNYTSQADLNLQNLHSFARKKLSIMITSSVVTIDTF